MKTIKLTFQTLVIVVLVQVTATSQVLTEEIVQRNNSFPENPFADMLLNDIDGDGDLDFLYDLGAELDVYKNDGRGDFTFFNSSNINITGHNNNYHFLDINNDQVDDILCSFLQSGIATIYLNDGNGNYSLYQTISTRGTYAAYDMNNDGQDDFVLAEIVDQPEERSQLLIWYIFYNDHVNSGQFVKQAVDTFKMPHYSSIKDVKVADFNNDGFGDILAIGSDVEEYVEGDFSDSRNAALFINNNNSSFSWSNEFGAEAGKYVRDFYPRVSFIEDINNDGKMDILLADQRDATVNSSLDSSKIIMYQNLGDAKFLEITINDFFIKIDQPQYGFFDVDNDGDVDLLYNGLIAEENLTDYMSPSSTEIMMIYKNDGNMRFSLFGSGDKFGTPSGLDLYTVGDVDGDGFKDIVTEEFLKRREPIDIYKNNSGYGFTYFYQDSIKPCLNSKILVDRLDDDLYTDILHGIPYLINENGNALSVESRNNAVCGVTYDNLLDYNGNGRMDYISFSNEFFSSKSLSLDSNMRYGNFSKPNYNDFQSMEDEISILVTGNINQNNQDEIIYVTENFEVKVMEYDAQSNDFVTSTIFTLSDFYDITEIQLMNFNGSNDILLWGYNSIESKYQCAKYNNDGNGNFNKETNYFTVADKQFVSKSVILNETFGDEEYLFTSATEYLGLSEYGNTWGDYGTDYYELADVEVTKAVKGSFAEFDSWTAVLYTDIITNETKLGLSYNHTLYDLDEISELFNFDYNYDGKNGLQVIDIKNDGDLELIVVGYSPEGTYQIKIFDIRLNPITGVPFVKKEGLNIFPSPATAYVNVSLDNNVENLNIEVYSVTGQLVISKQFKETNLATINLHEFPIGSYIVKVQTDFEIYSKKIIKH